MIAGEQIGRVCYGMELEPIYVDTIIRGWQAFTRQSAAQELTGCTFKELQEDAVNDKSKSEETKTQVADAGPKGQSVNRSRRPRTSPMSKVWRQILEQPLPVGIREILHRELRLNLEPDARFADAMVVAVFAKALTGDVSAIREITDRVEGRAAR